MENITSKSNEYYGSLIKVFNTEKYKEKTKKIDKEFIKKMTEAAHFSRIVVISFVGKAGRGKSTIASLFVHYLEKLNGVEEKNAKYIFELSNALKSKTKDLYCYDKILKIPDADMGILVMECQGDGTLPEKINEDDIESLNLEKNLFIAMSTSSLAIFVLEPRYTQDSFTSLKSFQNLFGKIKNTLEINYPGIVLLRNKSKNLRINENDLNNGEINERTRYIQEFVRAGALNGGEVNENLYATYFPEFYYNIPICDIINLEHAKTSFDYIIDIAKKYPKYLNTNKNLFANTQSLLKLVENIIKQMNNIEKRENFYKLVSPISQIIKNTIQFEYRTMKDYLKTVFRDILRNFGEFSLENIKATIDNEKFCILERFNKYEENDRRYYETKLLNFISFNLDSLCYKSIEESSITNLKKLEQELQTEKEEKEEQEETSDLEIFQKNLLKKKTEKEHYEIKSIVYEKSQLLEKVDNELERKINEKELVENNEKMTKKSKTIEIIKERTAKLVENKDLYKKYTEKEEKKFDLDYDLHTLEMEIKILDEKQRLENLPQQEINILEKAINQLLEESIKNYKLSGLTSNLEMNLKLEKAKIEATIKKDENNLRDARNNYSKILQELRELKLQNIKKEYIRSTHTDESGKLIQEISDLNREIMKLKTNKDSLKEILSNLIEENNYYKNLFNDKEFIRIAVEIRSIEEEIEGARKSSIFVMQFDEVEFRWNSLKVEKNCLKKELEIKMEKLERNNAEDLLENMDQIKKDEFEIKKRQIREKIKKEMSENLVQEEINLLIFTNNKLTEKIMEMKSDNIYQQLDNIKKKISISHYEMIEMIHSLKK